MTDAQVMHEFFQDMRKFLMKKEQKYGELKFISSRATTETSSNIDQLVEGLIEIFNAYKIIPTNQHTRSCLSVEAKFEPKISQSYRCLLLNTYFHVQPRLVEDILYGHLVGIWPTISPYLFMQIILGLMCEDLLMESILHIPLELCIEILEIASKCVAELEFERALRFLNNLIWYTYQRCFMLNTVGTQTENLAERTQYLVASFQILLDQLTNKLIDTPDLCKAIKHERHGIILKNIIRVTKMCIEVRLEDMPVTCQKLYTLTFGSEVYCKLDAESLQSIVTTLDNELIALLLNHIKQVDCHMYIAWAEMDDQDNIQLTLQRAIAIECYYFIKYMENDVTLSQNNELQECLQQLAGSSSKKSILTLHELCHGIANDRPDDMKELMNRYREWNLSTLDFIYERWSLLNKDDCQVLFEYLNYIFSQRLCTEVEKHKAQSMVIKIIMNRCLPDVYDIIITYMLRNFDHNFLEIFYDHDNFNSFIQSNTNIRDPLNLRFLLTFLLLNPQRVLTALIQIIIGCITHNGIVFTPQDMLLMRPFLCVRRDVDCTSLTYILKDICIRHDRWDTKKFINFVNAMVDAKVASSDDVINNVFIPYLAKQSFNEHNVNSVLIIIRKIINKCTENMNIVALCTALIHKISAWRKCDSKMRSSVNEVLMNITKLLDNYQYWPHQMNALQKQAMMDSVMAHIEPLSKANLAVLSCMPYGSILDIISDYERRCYTIRRQFKLWCESTEYKHDYAIIPKFEYDDFIRHMFLHCTEMEYQKYSFELAVVFWCFFGWNCEIDAYDNVLRITMEAARMTLEYPHEMPCDTFIVLLKYAIGFYCAFAKIEHMRNQEKEMLQILLKNLSYVGKSTRYTQYSTLYASLLAQLDCITKSTHLQDYLQESTKLINAFISEALQLMQMASESDSSSYFPSKDICDMHEAYKSVCICMSVPDMERHYQCIDKIEQFFVDNDDTLIDS